VGQSGLLFVNGLRIEGEIGLDEFQRGRGAGDDFSVKTGIATGMAGSGADLINHEDQGILIAVGANFNDLLGVSGSFAFVPDFRAGAGPVNSFTTFQSEFEGFLVHVGEHEGFLGGGIDGHGGDEAIGIEFRCEIGGFLDLGFVFAFGKGVGIWHDVGKLGFGTETSRICHERNFLSLGVLPFLQCEMGWLGFTR
jgi:hypothetical protein